jgi:hypothetical protein
MNCMTAMLCAALIMTAARAHSQDGPVPGAVAAPQPVIVAAAKAGGIPPGLAIGISDRGIELGKPAQLAQKALPDLKRLDGACIVR